MTTHPTPPLLLRMLLSVTRRLPPFWRISGVSNRIVKPIWCRFSKGAVVLPIWPPIRMHVDPCDVIGGNLAFIPQLYDRWERRELQRILPKGGVFVDVGSNIGAYALWAAMCVGPTGRVIAIEADPHNFSALEDNVKLNGMENVIACERTGVSDRSETLRLFQNERGNRGGHSFLGTGPVVSEVGCVTLAEIVKKAGISKIDAMKLDIEGFEERVLAKYFVDIPRSSPLRPDYLVVEIVGGPIRNRARQQELRDLICMNGYVLEAEDLNGLFRKVA